MITSEQKYDIASNVKQAGMSMQTSLNLMNEAIMKLATTDGEEVSKLLEQTIEALGRAISTLRYAQELANE